MKPTFFRGVVVGAATSIVVLAGTAALAGTGVGDVFNLGQTNTVDQSSVLQGNVSNNAQLQVTNTGTAAAVRGDSTGGRGVIGRHRDTAGTDPGVEGITASNESDAAGVIGRVPSTAGIDAAAVRGINPSIQPERYGVWGSVAGSGNGVYGQATGGSGVLGSATTGSGVLGTATGGIGVRGLSQSGPGAYGQNLSATRSVNGDEPGVVGRAAADDGGQFISNTGIGAWGFSGSLIGLLGIGPGEGFPNPLPATPAGVVGEINSSSNPGVLAQNDGTGPALKLVTSGAAAPMQVNSSTKVTDLNADMVDGFHASSFLQAGSCAQGLIHGFARIVGTASVPSTYTTSGVQAPFNCTGGQVLVRRVSAGVYFVRFATNLSQLLTGNVINDDNDFLSYRYMLDPLDNVSSFRIAVQSAGSAYEDRTFSVMTM